MTYEWMGVEYINREVWLREATLDLITAGERGAGSPSRHARRRGAGAVGHRHP